MDELLARFEDSRACTLPTTERPLRLMEFDSLFSESVRTVEHEAGVMRLRLSGRSGLERRVVELTAREAECCSFFAFTVQGTDDDLILEISVPPQRRDILAALASRARELNRAAREKA